MKLKRTTPCQLFTIKTPIWGGRAVGLNIKKLCIHNEVRCSYKNTDGELIYPNPFYISREKALEYPQQRLKNYPDVVLAIVPIKDLEALERED